jgi:AcrR family transcriptional regulator
MPRPSAKQKLLEAAITSFRFNGYKSCSIEDIATKAGVFKGSFYNHFRSKEALAVEILQHYVEKIVLPLLALVLVGLRSIDSAGFSRGALAIRYDRLTLWVSNPAVLERKSSWAGISGQDHGRSQILSV